MEGNGKELTYNLTYKEVVDVLKLVNDSDTCKELRLEVGDLKLEVVRDVNGGSSAASAANYTLPGNGTAQTVQTTPAGNGNGPAAAPQPVSEVPEVKEKSTASVGEITGPVIKAPLTGTFYRAPAPGEPPFVEVGSKVDEDTIIGIIDVMKLMNMIKAGQKGIVKEICVENEEMVDFDQVIIVLEPIS